MRHFPFASLFLATSLLAQEISFEHTWTPTMNLYVVFVRFEDESTDRPYDHQDYDQPYGWVKSGDKWVPGDKAYTLDDFKRMLGVSGTWRGTGIQVGNRTETVPEQFGSLEEYFDEASGQQMDLEVTIVNSAMEETQYSAYPKWIKLPETRWHYARMAGEYWRDAYAATIEAGYTLPSPHTVASRRSNKILFLHANTEIPDDRELHPQVDKVTTSNPMETNPREYGFQYMAGERRGSGTASGRSVDSFGGINIHAHEIGHLLGLSHWADRFSVNNPYTGQNAPEQQYGGDWNLMQSASHGPPIWKARRKSDGSYEAHIHVYGSAPMPPSVVYRKQLGWTGQQETITETMEDLVLTPGPAKFYRVVAMDHLTMPSSIYLDLRAATGFGQYVIWHRFKKMVGLLIWKEPRKSLDNFSRGISWEEPRLIPADGRLLRDSRNKGSDGEYLRQPIDESKVSGTDVPNLTSGVVYPWHDRLSDPFGHIADIGLPSGFTLGGTRRDLSHVDDTNGLVEGYSFQDYPPTRVAIRRIRMMPDADNVKTGKAKVNIYLNHWIGDVDPPNAMSVSDFHAEGQVYVGGDLTIKEGATLTIRGNSVVRFLEPITLDSNGNRQSDIIVEKGGTLMIERGVVFRSAMEPGRGTTPPPEPEDHGIIVESGGTVTMEGLTLATGTHSLEGKVTVSADISVGDHSIASDTEPPQAKLKIADDARILFENDRDVQDIGHSTDLAEIVVQKGSTLEIGEAALGNVTDRPTDPGWYGIYNKGTVVFDNTTLKSGERCYHKAVTTASATATGVKFVDCGMFSGNRAQSVLENIPTTDVLGSYAALPELTSFGTIAWSKEGDDHVDFALNSDETAAVYELTFGSSPNYENKIAHNVIVKAVATSGTKTVATAKQNVTVQIIDVEEGTVPGPPLIVPGEQTTTQQKVRVRLTRNGSSKTRYILYRLSYVDSDGNQQWDGGNSQWRTREVDYQSETNYAKWFQPGGEFAFTIQPNLTYTLEVRATECKVNPETPCDGGFNEDLYQHSTVTSHSFDTTQPVEVLTIQGDSEIDRWYDEIMVSPLATYTATDAAGNSVTPDWEIVGDTTPGFRMTEAGKLLFTDQRPFFIDGGTNIHTVTIKATGRNQASDDFPVTVTLKKNIKALFSFPDGINPQAGSSFRVTVQDPDHSTNFRWTWERGAGGGAQVHTENFPTDEGSSTSTYSVQDADVNHVLKAIVIYNDDRRTDTRAVVTTEPVIAAPTDSPGSVSFLPDPPRATRTLTASLNDDDEVHDTPVPVWSWVRILSTGGEEALTNVTSNTYEPTEDDDVGHQLRATVVYTDDFGQHTVNNTTGTVLDAPAPPVTNTQGTLTYLPNPPVATQDLTFTLRDVDGVLDTPRPVWTWVRVPATGSEQTLTGVTTNTHQPVATDVGSTLRVSVAYSDRFGRHTLETTTMAVVAAPPTDVTGTLDYSPKPPVATQTLTFTLTDPDLRPEDPSPRWTWTLVPEMGDEEALTSVTSNTYEVPAANAEDRLSVNVTYTDAFGEHTLSLTTSEIAPAPPTNNPGSVDFEYPDDATAPQEEAQITAVLEDPDSPEGTTWTWVRVTGADSETALTSTDATDGNATYTPVEADVGHTLKATATYTDRFGGQTASEATEPVQAAPCPPSALQHDPGDGEARIVWAEPPSDCGSIGGYKYRYQATGAGSWTSGTLGAGGEYTVPQLSNGTAYTFELRATNGSDSAPVSITFTAGVPDPPRVGVERLGRLRRQLRVGLVPGEDNGSALTTYTIEIWYTRANGTTGELFSGTGRVPSGPDPFLIGSWALASNRIYTIEATVSNGRGTSAVASRVVATTENTPGTVRFEAAAPPRVGREVTAVLTDPDRPRSIT